MKIKLVFDDWHNSKGQSIYSHEDGIDLILGDFHSGTVFDGEIDLTKGDAQWLQKQIEAGKYPIFRISL